jgi:hypothetical protein
MAKKFRSPSIVLKLTEEGRERALASNSGGCLIADAIKEQYPAFIRVSVDMATIAFTDPERGVRYTYLTPPAAQHALLAFDQGWPNPVQEVRLHQAVRINPIFRSPSDVERAARVRASRIEVLEAKEATGNLTRYEKSALTKMRTFTPTERPTSSGPSEVDTVHRQTVVHGGAYPVKGKAHPNLLRGRNRHFGAKLADPGAAFNEAVEAAVAQRLSEMADA